MSRNDYMQLLMFPFFTAKPLDTNLAQKTTLQTSFTVVISFVFSSIIFLSWIIDKISTVKSERSFIPSTSHFKCRSDKALLLDSSASLTFYGENLTFISLFDTKVTS